MNSVFNHKLRRKPGSERQLRADLQLHPNRDRIRDRDVSDHVVVTALRWRKSGKPQPDNPGRHRRLTGCCFLNLGFERKHTPCPIYARVLCGHMWDANHPRPARAPHTPVFYAGLCGTRCTRVRQQSFTYHVEYFVPFNAVPCDNE